MSSKCWEQNFRFFSFLLIILKKVRKIIKIESLFPQKCQECDTEYCITLDDTEEDRLQCFFCTQFSHNCKNISEKISVQKTIDPCWRPLGTVWLCKGCYTKNNYYNTPVPIEPQIPPNLPIQFFTQTTTGGSGYQQNTNTHTQTPIDISTQTTICGNQHATDPNVPAIPSTQATMDGDQHSTTINPLPQTNQKTGNPIPHAHNKEICEKYRHGKCPHGINGNKIFEGKTCSYSHPNRCFKFCRYGSAHQWGCSFGSSCKYFHPILCKNSARYGSCTNQSCTYVHLVGTNRRPKRDTFIYPNKRHHNFYQNEHQHTIPYNQQPNTHSQNYDEHNPPTQRSQWPTLSQSNPTEYPTNNAHSNYNLQNQETAKNSAFLKSIREMISSGLKECRESILNDVRNMNLIHQEENAQEQMAPIHQPSPPYPQNNHILPPWHGNQTPSAPPWQMGMVPPAQNPIYHH